MLAQTRENIPPRNTAKTLQISIRAWFGSLDNFVNTNPLLNHKIEIQKERFWQ